MLNMKKIISILIVSLTGFSLFGCDEVYASSKIENIKLMFVQHSYISHIDNIGYYFKNDQLATTEMIFEKGIYLDKPLIDSFYKNINYIVPALVGDGYWMFTFFYKRF